MTERTRRGLGVLGAASALGLVGDLLLRETPWGLNWLLWASFAVATTVLVARRSAFQRPRGWPFLLAGALFFSAALAWRAAPNLAALNLFAAACCAALATGVLRTGVVTYAAAAGRLTAEAGAGPILAIADDVQWDEVPRSRWTPHAGAAARGFVIAVPLVFVFGGLFVAADAVFESFVSDLFDVDDLFVHAIVFALWAWVGAGIVRHLLVERAPIAFAPDRRFGTVEVAVVLGALNALFLAFVLVQLRYLFGGDDHVVDTTGLTYAEYARRGFFELVTVAALTTLVLLAGESLAKSRRAFRWLAAMLIVLVAVVMASALERMRLYTDAYGLTQLRLYVTAFMLWLALVFAWMLFTLLRERHSLFMPGALVAGLATLLALNAVSPDAMIARVNLDRHLEYGKQLDVDYLGGLSADATPTAVARLDRLGPDARRQLLACMEGEHDDWRTWNWGRMRAGDALRDYESSARAANR